MSCSYIIDLNNRDITIDEVHKQLVLMNLSEMLQRAAKRLRLAIDKKGNSRGVAFITVAVGDTYKIEKIDGSYIKGRQIKVHKEHGNKKLLKYKRWTEEHCKKGLVSTNIIKTNKTLVYKRLPMDTHCYDACADLTHRTIRKNRDTIIADAFRCGVKKMNIPGRSIGQCKQAAILAERYSTTGPHITFSAGINGRHAAEWNEQCEQELVKLYKHPACKSAGLIGLDFTFEGLKHSNRGQQLEVLEAQIKLAIIHQKPLFVYEKWATRELLRLLKIYFQNKTGIPSVAVFADFLYDFDSVQQIGYLGCYLAVIGHVTQKRCNLSSRIPKFLEKKRFPENRILLISDCPNIVHENECENTVYKSSEFESTLQNISPPLNHECPSDPTNVFFIKDMVANCLGHQYEEAETLSDTLRDNYCRFFQIDEYQTCTQKSQDLDIKSRTFSKFSYNNDRQFLGNAYDVFQTAFLILLVEAFVIFFVYL